MPVNTYTDMFGNVMSVQEAPVDSITAVAECGHGRRRAEKGAKVDSWDALPVGCKVSLWKRKKFIATGTVDETMPDGSAVWLYLPKEFRRTLIHVSDGIFLTHADDLWEQSKDN
jgi:hypothetical protein